MGCSWLGSSVGSEHELVVSASGRCMCRGRGRARKGNKLVRLLARQASYWACVTADQVWAWRKSTGQPVGPSLLDQA